MSTTNGQTPPADPLDAHGAAVRYLRAGYCPVPIPSRTKAPVLSGWQKLQPTEEDLDNLFPEDKPLNIGWLLGNASPARPLDVDLDCAETRAIAGYFLPVTALKSGRASCPRSHWWYRAAGSGRLPGTVQCEDEGGAKLVELRSSGGQTVVPPSMHPAGEAVTWEEFGPPAVVEYAELRTAMHKLAAAAILARHWPKGSRQDAALALAGGLLRAGWAGRDVETFIAAVCKAAGDSDASQRLSAIPPTMEKVKNNAHVRGFPSLIELVSDKVVLKVWNWLGIQAPKETAGEPADATEAAALEPFPKAVPISQLEPRPRGVRPIWQGCAMAGTVTLLSAVWKVGKSTLLSHLVKLLDLGGSLGGLTVQPAKVLVVSEEIPDAWIERRDRLGIGDHVRMICQPFLLKPTEKVWQQFIGHITAEAGEQGADLVILDTLNNLWSVQNENDASEVQAAMMPLRQVTTGDRGLLITGHLRKSDGQEGTATRGSGALMGAVDTILEMRRFSPSNPNDRRRVLTGFGRFAETPAELVLELAKDGMSYTGAGTRREATARELNQEIVYLLPNVPPGKTRDELLADWSDEAKPRKQTLLDALEMGANRGEWRREGEGKKGSPYRYWAKPPG
jgi:hypothetical protein